RAPWLRERLTHFARAQSFLRALSLWKESEGGLGEGAEPGEVDFEMYALRGGDDAQGVRVLPGDVPKLRPGQAGRLAGVNRNAFAVDVSLLRIDPGSGIRSHFPREAGEDNRLPAFASRSWLWEVPAGAAGLEHWAMIAVRAEAGAPQTNFLFLQQPSYEE